MSTEQGTLCREAEALLLVIDIQQRLAAAMAEEAKTAVCRNAGILAQAARWLGIPRFVTEQYPKGLGPTDPGVLDQLGEDVVRFEKTTFSCCGADGFLTALRASGRRQVVIAGMEAHVCVLQTSVELAAEGFEVFVVEDAVCSRDPRNHRNACERLRQAGITVVNTESVLFEWLRDSRHERFKAVSALLR